MKWHVLSLLLVSIMASCSLEYKDVSDSSEYSDVIGKEFYLKSDLTAYGVTRDIRKRDKIDFVVIRADKISGPEVVLSEAVPAGSMIRVEKVYVARGILKNFVEYRVTTQLKKLDKHKVVVRATKEKDNGNYGLDEALFYR